MNFVLCSQSFTYIFVSLPSATVELPGSRGYHDKVIDHYENPRNVGSLDKNDENVGTGLVGAPACGDVMKLQVYQTIFRYFTISVTKIIMQMKFNFNSTTEFTILLRTIILQGWVSDV